MAISKVISEFKQGETGLIIYISVQSAILFSDLFSDLFSVYFKFANFSSVGKHAIFYLNLFRVQKQYIIIKCTDDSKNLFAFKKYHKNLVSVDFANSWPPAMWKTQRWEFFCLFLFFPLTSFHYWSRFKWQENR